MPPTGAPTPPTKLINNLPPEVLIRIFSIVLSSGLRFALFSHFSSPISSPWTLALVCLHWKSIIYSVPSFWSTFIVSFSPISEVCAKRGVNEEGAERLTSALLRGVNAALLRSREHPLQICLSSSSDFTAIQFLPEAMSLCLRHCKRWEGAYMEFWWDTLDLKCPDLVETIGRDMDGNRLSFPRLRNLFLKGPGSVSASVPLPKKSWLYIFQEAPLLLAVQFKGDPHLVSELQGTLNWSNLTQFSTEISCVNLFLKCCRVLCACPKLAVFKLSLSPYPSQPQLGMDIPDSGTSFQDVELLELKDFWICFEGGGRFDLSPIFRFFPRSPRLSRMSLQPKKSVFITDDFLAELASFTSRSQCAISYLHIDHLPARQAMVLFQHLPYVEVLVAEEVYFDEALIGRLSTPPDTSHLQPGAIPVLLPRLRRIGVLGITRVDLEPSFRRIFESRFSYPAVDGGPTLEGADVGLLIYPDA